MPHDAVDIARACYLACTDEDRATYFARSRPNRCSIAAFELIHTAVDGRGHDCSVNGRPPAGFLNRDAIGATWVESFQMDLVPGL
jgi:hypothetical protein